MGARSNIYFRNKDGGIGVYAHWGGYSVVEAAAKVLQSSAFKQRIGDPSYATRIGVQIVLEELGADSKKDTGFGLWTSLSGPGDNEYPIIVIDVNDGAAYVTKEWAKPGDGERVQNPTEEELSQRMRG